MNRELGQISHTRDKQCGQDIWLRVGRGQDTRDIANSFELVDGNAKVLILTVVGEIFSFGDPLRYMVLWLEENAFTSTRRHCIDPQTLNPTCYLWRISDCPREKEQRHGALRSVAVFKIDFMVEKRLGYGGYSL